MAEFRPIFPAHAIERCSITLVFADEVPEKALKRIVEGATPNILQLGLKRGLQPMGFQVDTLTGKMTPLKEGGPVNFVSAGNRQQLALVPNALTWATQNYVRWSQFSSEFSKIASPIIEEYEAITSISSIQLEYWDRFIWDGDWISFDVHKLLDNDSQFLAPKAINAEKEWHNHIGWFEDIDEIRRLWNVNIDVVGIAESVGSVRPSVGIYSMARDQILLNGEPGLFESQFVKLRLDGLHDALKNVLKGLICRQMARKIGLDSGE